ncbi:MAG: hypothetical protein WBD20_21550 [Pirellulaceae bacterium]
MISQLRRSYDQWWSYLPPLMVNENLPRVAPADQPLAIRYHKQFAEKGISDWTPDEL